jgi:hypothetical protein
MSYEGFYIDKHSSCWVLKHSEPDVGVWSGKTKRECLQYLARHFLGIEQDILVDGYQEKMREQGECYSHNDALDALLHEAQYNSKHFIEVLRPELKKRFEASGQATFEVEIVG